MSVAPAATIRLASMDNPPLVRPQSGPQHALFDLVNQTRRQAGLQELVWDDKLAGAAWGHAKVMAEQGVLSHQLASEAPLIERLTAHSARLDRASENVVYDITVEGAHDNFMSSPPHRANILNPAFDAIGIGVVETGGILYVTEDFTHRLVDVPDEEAAQMAATTFSHLRRSAGADELTLISAPALHQAVESVVQREIPDGGPGLALAGARVSASYAATTPSQLPPPIAQLATLQGLTHYSVAACYARTPKYPGGLYWVTIVLYHAPGLALDFEGTGD